MSKSTKAKEQIITRFAPSPTGHLNIGGFRTALFSFVYAKQHGGKTILRIEDTDKERSTKESEKNILDSLEWLNLKFDETYRQSDRTEIYKKYLQELVKSGQAYISNEEVDEKNKNIKRSSVIRFKNPKKQINFFDIIRGEISFDTAELGDFVIAKSLDEPLYHLAVVVDDHEMNVSHVIRGEEHISNTPRQILILEAIGAKRPVYAHLPLILDNQRAKLSKRKGAISIFEYKEKGYLPEAILNFTALLGWNPGTDQEIFSLEELIKFFDIAKVQKSGAIFNEEKLKWINKHYLKRLSEIKITEKIKKFIELSKRYKENKWKIKDDLIQRIIPVLMDRVSTFDELTAMTESGDLDYLFQAPEYKIDDLIWKDEKDNENTKDYLADVINILNKAHEENFGNSESIKKMIWDYATLKGRGNVLWPIRFALTGKIKSPDPFTLIWTLGKKESLRRLDTAKKLLNKL